MHYRLIFADDTEIQCEICGEAPGEDTLYIVCEPMTVAEAAQLFSVPTKTERMIFAWNDGQDVFEGFTELQSIRVNSAQTQVFMKKVTA